MARGTQKRKTRDVPQGLRGGVRGEGMIVQVHKLEKKRVRFVVIIVCLFTVFGTCVCCVCVCVCVFEGRVQGECRVCVLL